MSTLVELLVMAIVGYSLYRIKQRFDGLLSTEGQVAKPGPGGIFNLRVAVQLVAVLLAIDLTFFVAVVIRNHLFVAPNEPTVQIAYIERHIAATLEGYRLDDVETVEWKLPPEPLSAQQLLASRTVQNAPILPTWVTKLEEPPDIQHYERIKAAGSTLVYGPMLQIYECFPSAEVGHFRGLS